MTRYLKCYIHYINQRLGRDSASLLTFDELIPSPGDEYKKKLV